MGIFSNIMNKILGKKTDAKTDAKTETTEAKKVLSGIDVEKVLADMAKAKGGGGNYKVSIVDLLKLLDLDSSLAARKELAAELKVNAGPHGSAEQNIALHKAVLDELAKNGGKVPANLKK